MGYRVVVVGATGNVGREILNILAERQFPVDEVAAVASPRSTGDIIDFGDSGKELKVQNIEHFDFAGWDIALFAAGSEVSAGSMRPRAAAAGCTVIDNSSLYRMDPDVPLIVPEVNPEAIDGYRAQEHHRQPQLLDRADGRGAEAAARRGDGSSASSSRPTSRCRARARRGWTSCSSRAATSSSATPTSRRSSPSRSPSTSSRTSTTSSTTARPRRNGRWWSRPRRSSIRRSRSPRPASACRCSSAIAEAINIEFENEISADAGAGNPARGAGHHAGR